MPTNHFYRKNEAASLPRSEFVPKTLSDLGVIDSLNGGLPTTNITGETWEDEVVWPFDTTSNSR